MRQLATWGVPPERIAVVGNLAIDGAFDEAQGAFSTSPPDEAAVDGGVLIMPGTRRREVENLVPFYLRSRSGCARSWPSLPVAFGISPFTTRRRN